MSLRVFVLSLFVILLLSDNYFGQADTTSGPADQQTTQSNSTTKDTLDGWALTFTPSAYMNLFIGTQLGIEKGFSGLGLLEIEYAHIHKQIGNDELWKEGRRIKLNAKFPRRKNPKNLTVVSYTNRKTHHFRESIVPRNNGAYFETINYTKTKTLSALSIGLTRKKALSNKLALELGFSIGGGKYEIENLDFPEGVDELNENFWQSYFTPGIYFYPVIAGTLKLSYRFIGQPLRTSKSN